MRPKHTPFFRKVKYFITQGQHIFSAGMLHWYRWTAPEMPLKDAPLPQREAARRGRLISTVLLVLTIGLFVCTVSTFFAPGLPAYAIVGETWIVVALTGFFNRQGKHIIASFLYIINAELALILFIVTIPGGIHTINIPLLDIFIVPALLGAVLLPSWSVMPIAISNIIIICFILLFLPETMELHSFIVSSSVPFFTPILLQVMVAGISTLWGRSALQALKDADRADELDRLYQEQARRAITDAITGLPNHRAIMQCLQEMLASHGRKEQGCALLFIDLDHFKRINDTWGHLAGDTVLREAGRRLQIVTENQGVVGRYGGEEFAVVLPAIDLSTACIVAEQMRASLAMEPCIWQAENGEETPIAISASIGIAMFALHGTNSGSLLEAADQAMYRAKQQGRNQVCVADLGPVDTCAYTEQPIPQEQHEEAEASAVRALQAAVRAHDEGTGDHAQRMVSLAESVARYLGSSPEECHLIRLAALLHDVGKIGVPGELLRKTGPLTPQEWDSMRMHPVIGAAILNEVEGVLARVAHIVKAHHERWDGQGYPFKLCREAIPLGARIITVVDSYDAMISNRPYRQALSVEQARTELRRCAGSQFDPRVVEALLAVLEAPESKPGPVSQLPETVQA